MLLVCLPAYKFTVKCTQVQYASKKQTNRVRRVESSLRIHCARVRTIVEDHGCTGKQLPSTIVDPCLYYCCTAHQVLAALRSRAV